MGRTHQGIVINDEYRKRLQASFMRLDFCGEGKEKASAAGRLVDRPQASTMRFDDGTADPKSHAGPLRLGGKERIKDLIRLLRREPHACIADRDHQLAVFGLLRADD